MQVTARGALAAAAAGALAVAASAWVFIPADARWGFILLALVVGASVCAATALAGRRMERAFWQSIRDLTHERDRLLEELRHAEDERAELAVILEQMADGVLVLDADERVALCNPAALRLLHQTSADGRRLAEVARDAGIVEVARAAHGTVPVSQVVEIQRRPGLPRRWVQAVSARLPGGGRTLVLLQDVSELRRVEAARRDFVANVSHELRTPIAALKALVETLESGAMEEPEVGRDFLRRMHREVDGMALMVSELLQLARIESGRLDLALKPCRVGELVREAVDRMSAYAERVDLHVRLGALPTEETLVSADEVRIGQVLANLLSNALKFTPPGGRIEVGARADREMVELWVSDSGTGIHADDLVRVFERFYKADPSRTGSGTGLGLAICKHVVLAHGGLIWAESPGPGQGSTFRFTLRRGEPALALPPAPSRWEARVPEGSLDLPMTQSVTTGGG